MIYYLIQAIAATTACNIMDTDASLKNALSASMDKDPV